uniref:receptor protein serine/threonine kinase n=1 Tax=Neogobius melanostomus TaxID=47308 RepID=A0A8C6S5N6_9GOBI
MDLLLPTWSLLLEFVLLGLSDQVFCQMRRCRYQSRPHRRQYDMVGAVNGSEQHCFYTNCCLALYLITDHGELEVDTLACYLRYKSCSEDACTRVNHHFLHCVCNGDLCNNVTSWTQEEERLVPLQNSNGTSSCFILRNKLVHKQSCFKFYSLSDRKPVQRPEHWTNMVVFPGSCQDSISTMLTSAITRLCSQELRCGTFATVWEGRFEGVPVAVKVFPKAWRHKFVVEREVHRLLEFGHPHPNIVQYLVAGSIGACRSSGPFAIVLEYGSLHSYLSVHTSSWTSCLTLCQSLSEGLSHLHEEGVHKPAVAHGDLSSSNVLVKADGTCALCDFGCSTSCGPGCTWEGALLYMSPEILEGSVMFNHSWHLQADVYSLGLVLWEVWMRCSDLFGERVPPHLLPYEQELRPSVTLEGLLQLVLFSEQRPAIPKSVADLLSCCWDADAEARLSASCAADRLASLSSSTREDSCVMGNFCNIHSKEHILTRVTSWISVRLVSLFLLKQY